MSYLTILECPVTYNDADSYEQSSIDMCPTVGITQGLVSRHVKVQDSRLLVVCIWKDRADSELVFDTEWYAKAEERWGSDYQLRLETLGATSAA
ncbi:hypothetical protein ASG40_16855 [Methylobacterium sp. Leaf399]|uniref:hypothetical protein n=1 Tax=unclassified Methylobacterium TaxID=2615210 RepID=UPI0006F9E3A0|nr:MULTISPECIES: hypothetical protein [unclassified Methylobacterium]KQP59127.1 hypothetical protein ASF39_16840 [Methylobacterium sp. Leaf108]KQT18728.1 hypothetical protein ASG40_16855 [Methylobacterium sp. Leaf399]KQT88792.1 hypothetical protein ASG59_14465 [Methylobacterium sp. Leaf466]